MGSPFKSFFADVALPGLTENFFGEVGEYIPVGGGPSVPDILVVLDTGVVIQPISYDASTVETGDTLEALVVDVGDVSEGDIFIVDSIQYECKKELENNGAVTKWVVHGG